MVNLKYDASWYLSLSYGLPVSQQIPGAQRKIDAREGWPETPRGESLRDP